MITIGNIGVYVYVYISVYIYISPIHETILECNICPQETQSARPVSESVSQFGRPRFAVAAAVCSCTLMNHKEAVLDETRNNFLTQWTPESLLACLPLPLSGSMSVNRQDASGRASVQGRVRELLAVKY